jgi:hypothetical protein
MAMEEMHIPQKLIALVRATMRKTQGQIKIQNMIKKVFNKKLEGTRKVGRPRLRWEECVWQDIRILGIRNWRNVALS